MKQQHFVEQQVTKLARTEEEILIQQKEVNQQDLTKIADILANTVQSISKSQYVLRDKMSYSSVYQTPVRDNLRVLRMLSNELRHKAIMPTNSIESPDMNSTNRICSEQVIRDIFPALKNYAAQTGRVLRLRENAHGYVDMRFGSIEKMLRELVLNAIQHNPIGTDIEIVCSCTGKHVVFEINDMGAGISLKTINEVFGMQKSLECRSRRLSDAETHLNINSVSHLASINGGDLEIKSALGLGTCIRLLLPADELYPGPAYGKFIKDKKYIINETRNRKKILFLTKNRIAQCQTMQSLSERYTMYVCSSFNKAIAVLFEAQPDIVVADVSWQHSLGVQFCKFVRTSYVASRLPVVLLTMPLAQDSRVSMYSCGVSAVLEKPLASQEIEVVLKNLIDNHSHLSFEVHEPHSPYSVMSSTRNTQSNANEQQFKSRLLKVVADQYKDENFNRFKASDALFISEKTLQRRMKKYFGESFCKFLRRYKLEQGKQMLLDNKSITEVSFELGFTTTSYFGQCFKVEFGYPPSMLPKVAA